jgi:hypothetical protein
MGIGRQLPPATVAEQNSIGRAKDFLLTKSTLRRIDQFDADLGSNSQPSRGRGAQLADSPAKSTSGQPHT